MQYRCVFQDHILGNMSLDFPPFLIENKESLMLVLRLSSKYAYEDFRLPQVRGNLDFAYRDEAFERRCVIFFNYVGNFPSEKFIDAGILPDFAILLIVFPFKLSEDGLLEFNIVNLYLVTLLEIEVVQANSAFEPLPDLLTSSWNLSK